MFDSRGVGAIPPPLTSHPEKTGGYVKKEERPLKHTVSLKQNHEFRRLYHKGKSAVSPYFVIYCRKNNREMSRLGITTGVKLGNAVKRNRARRRIRALYRTNEANILPGYDIVVVARTRVIFGNYAELEHSFRKLIKKLDLAAPKEESRA